VFVKTNIRGGASAEYGGGLTQTCAGSTSWYDYIIIIIFYFPAQHKTNEDNNSWIQEYAGRLPEKQTLIKLATYLVIWL